MAVTDFVRVVYSSQIECDWNNELLIINEDIRHIQKHHVIIFFEVVDIFNTNRNLENIGNCSDCSRFILLNLIHVCLNFILFLHFQQSPMVGIQFVGHF